MSNTILRSISGMVVFAALCAPPVPASQQDDASHRRRQPATATVAATAAPSAAVPASRSSATPAVVRKYQITASEGRIIPGHIRARRGELLRITFVSTDGTY